MTGIYELTNKEICAKIGKKLKNIRLNINMTQKELAERSGIGKMTISGFESGRITVSMVTFIQILRALDKLDMIDSVFLQPEPISPELLYKLKRKKRQRATTK